MDRKIDRVKQRKIFAIDDEFIIYNLSDEDRSDYVELHRQLNGDTSLYLNSVLKDMMWEGILNNADSVFSLFTIKGDYCGSIELQQSDSETPEIGIDLMESKRNKGIAPKAIRLFAKKVYEIKKVDYFLIRISSKNMHSQHIFEKMGAVKIAEEETAFSKFVERFREAAEKEKQKLERFRDLCEEDTDEVVYCYRLNPDTFL